MNPYLLGHWLGDGTSNGASFTTMDKEIVDYYEKVLPHHTLSVYENKYNGKASTYGIRGNKGYKIFLPYGSTEIQSSKKQTYSMAI